MLFLFTNVNYLSYNDVGPMHLLCSLLVAAELIFVFQFGPWATVYDFNQINISQK